jgi:putative ABC transport system permease protein
MSDAFIVNEEAIKEMGIGNPLNKNLSTWFGRKGKIIGVIHNFNTQSLRDEMAPVVFIPTPAANYHCLRISSPDIPGAIKSIENKIKEIVPDDPFEFRFLDEVIDSQYKTEQMISKLAMFIAIIAIFISCLGLFGLASFSCEQRTKEIGIRKVLGASITNVMVMLTKDFTKWVLLANIIAWPIAWYVVNKWLQNFAYRIDMTIWPFILAGFSALAIAIGTISWQAIKAATANPVESLHYE